MPAVSAKSPISAAMSRIRPAGSAAMSRSLAPNWRPKNAAPISSVATRVAMAELAADNLIAALTGNTAPTPINAADLQQRD